MQERVSAVYHSHFLGMFIKPTSCNGFRALAETNAKIALKYVTTSEFKLNVSIYRSILLK